MTQVNSPFLLSKIRPLNEYTDIQNNYFFQLERMLQQLYQRTGGPVDAIANIPTDISTNNDGASVHNYAAILDLLSRMEALESAKELDKEQIRTNFITTNANYSAAPFDDVTAKSDAKITLPATLGYNEVITVRNGDGSKIKISAGGTKFKRRLLTDALTTLRKGTTLVFTYKVDEGVYVL